MKFLNKMKLLNKIENIVTNKLRQVNDSLFFATIDGIYRTTTGAEIDCLIKLDKKIFYYYILQDNSILYQYEKDQDQSFYCNGKEIKGQYYLDSIFEYNDCFLLRGKKLDKEIDKKFVFKFDKNLNAEIINLERCPDYNIDNERYLSRSNVISCRRYSDGKELWRYDSETFGSKDFYVAGAGDVIIYGKSAFFSMTSGVLSTNPTPSATVQIDLETGKEINRYNNFLFPVLSGNRLITAGYKAMVILNLDDNKIITKDYSQYMVPENLDFGNYYVSGNDFYFKASDIRMDSYIGIINIETEEFALQALNKNKKTYKLAAREIKLCNNKLYVLGSNRVLYVYEK